jgi:hypothetical protein
MKICSAVLELSQEADKYGGWLRHYGRWRQYGDVITGYVVIGENPGYDVIA